MRARRLIAAASVAVGLVAIAGCRAEPGVAAYVGDHRITEDAVTRLLDELRAEQSTPSASPEQAAPNGLRMPSRNQVVSNLVLLDVCQRIADDKGYQPQQQITADQVGPQLGVPADTAYAERVAELTTCMNSLPAAEPVAPTEQDLVELVTAGKAAGVIPAEVTIQQAAAQLDGDQLRGALGSKKVLAKAVADYQVSVSPRYRPLEIPLLSFAAGQAAVSVPLGEPGSDAVTDVSKPEPEVSESAGAVTP
ncbi:hypothetical protein ONA91_13070 [Micromonospora sp. DR5-3]|uniref:hypothetical protein n=1 Tax=unclassified Micromonospora TaxID=2617518 RepID=UPI0011D5D55E|nr:MULTISPECIES: hypothetical protein [unclassified Micromonospora]MCW3815387.1 hypothetical protein [Micromonospora sp. DR5-3]TYC22842.1 hypothetical protein FXF52_18790 [Micromonospora sp. MP36]